LPHPASWLAFSLIALGLVLTPGPNMIYLVSRSISQGRAAAMVSLGGVALGFVVYMLSASLGVTALLLAVPLAYDALRICGAGYLLYLAWQSVRPGGASVFAPRGLSQDAPRKLFAMGLMTSLLNPKVAVLYLSLLPQFVDPGRGDVLTQSLVLGSTQIAISVSVNAVIAMLAGGIAGFLGRRPTWMKVQRWIMATVLAGFAARLAIDSRR
jgi:threonine/homoserine/homoserine lactone efflux protein